MPPILFDAMCVMRGGLVAFLPFVVLGCRYQTPILIQSCRSFRCQPALLFTHFNLKYPLKCSFFHHRSNMMLFTQGKTSRPNEWYLWRLHCEPDRIFKHCSPRSKTRAGSTIRQGTGRTGIPRTASPNSNPSVPSTVRWKCFFYTLHYITLHSITSQALPFLIRRIQKPLSR